MLRSWLESRVEQLTAGLKERGHKDDVSGGVQEVRQAVRVHDHEAHVGVATEVAIRHGPEVSVRVP